MKRLVAAVCLILISVGLSVWGQYELNTTCDELIDELTQCVETAKGDDEKALIEKSEYIGEWWDENRTKLSVLVNHSTLDTVQSFLPTLKELAEIGDTEELIENCYECINMTEDLKMNAQVSLGNVF